MSVTPVNRNGTTRFADDAYYFATILPGDYDGLVWFSKSTPTALRP